MNIHEAHVHQSDHDRGFENTIIIAAKGGKPHQDLS
jgi:hypothetical protein